LGPKLKKVSILKNLKPGNTWVHRKKSEKEPIFVGPEPTGVSPYSQLPHAPSLVLFKYDSI
jgi:hypothetical protein